MKSNNVLVAFGLFTIFMGIGLFFFPPLFYFLLGVPAAAATTLFMRFFGVLLFLEGVFFYGSRKTADLRVIKSFYFGSIIADCVMGLLSLDAAYNGVVNSLGYAFSALFFIFALIYWLAYLPLKKATTV